MRLVAVLVGFVLCAVACSGAQAETPAVQAQPAAALPAPTATEVPPTATAVPEPTSTPEPTATAVPTAEPTVDPITKVSAAVLAFQTEYNDLIAAGEPAAFWSFIADHLWPAGEWTPQMIECLSVNAGATFDKYNASFYDFATLAETPNWQNPDSAAPGGGQVPGPGTYAVARQTGIATSQRHVIYQDGQLLIPVSGDPSC